MFVHGRAAVFRREREFVAAQIHGWRERIRRHEVLEVDCRIVAVLGAELCENRLQQIVGRRLQRIALRVMS
jgi:hypothetical protein